MITWLKHRVLFYAIFLLFFFCSETFLLFKDCLTYTLFCTIIQSHHMTTASILKSLNVLPRTRGFKDATLQSLSRYTFFSSDQNKERYSFSIVHLQFIVDKSMQEICQNVPLLFVGSNAYPLFLDDENGPK